MPNEHVALSSTRIRAATAEDVGLVLQFIRELAEYEQLSHEVNASETLLREHLFAEAPAAQVIIAETDGVPAGFAVFFQNFSTFAGKPGIYLEDLFVRPAVRGRGVGAALLKHLASLAVNRGCAHVEWVVLDWNRPAIGFYESLGARPKRDWTLYRIADEALVRLAQQPM